MDYEMHQANFNSIVVRLKVYDRLIGSEEIDAFQFHYGAVKRMHVFAPQCLNQISIPLWCG